MVAHTPCFRSEAGSYGKDTKGIIRQHQFEKVELVHITRPQEAEESLDIITSHAEKIMEDLEICILNKLSIANPYEIKDEN